MAGARVAPAEPPREGRFGDDARDSWSRRKARMWIPGDSAGMPVSWPAFWSDGQNWSAAGEDDIMEVLSRINHTLHNALIQARRAYRFTTFASGSTDRAARVQFEPGYAATARVGTTVPTTNPVVAMMKPPTTAAARTRPNGSPVNASPTPRKTARGS
jgi:hypothetical protein